MNSKAKLLAACAALSAAGLLTAASFFGCSEKEEHVIGKDETATETTTVAEPLTFPVYNDYVPSEKGMTEKAKISRKNVLI